MASARQPPAGVGLRAPGTLGEPSLMVSPLFLLTGGSRCERWVRRLRKPYRRSPGLKSVLGKGLQPLPLLLGRAECISKGLVFAQFALLSPFDYVAKIHGVYFSFILIIQCHW